VFGKTSMEKCLIATKIREGKEELRLRDNEGHPIWIGWQQMK